MRRSHLISLLILLVGGIAGIYYLSKDTTTPVVGHSVPVYRLKVIRNFPHDPSFFTQGLAWDEGYLYAGSGRYGESRVRKLDLENNVVILEHALDRSYFGEGITIFNDRVIQLTWLKGTAFAYDKEDFSLKGRFQYPNEGWGLTHDGKHLIMSDGSSTLHFMNPNTFAETGRLAVKVGDRPLADLNELEYVEGEIFANILNSDWIARIDGSTGQVTGWIRADNLLTRQDRQKGAEVLNGIAYDPVGSRLFLTGKMWPKIFEVNLISEKK